MTKQYCCSCMEPMETEELCSFCGFRQSDYRAEAHQLSPGTILRDRYAIGRVLGEGGFGITYVGKDIVLERKVAVKEFYMSGYVNRNCTVSSEVLASIGTQGDTFEKNKEKFLTEARVLARFDDEGIVNIRDFFQENNTAYIVMDFLSGETLRDYVKRIGKLTAEEIVSILEPVFHALSNVHAHDLIHRDISPDNIMLTDDGKVKLLDFGAAREVSKADAKSLSIILKPGYAPEEQYRSRGMQGPWTDIYALCATMYRCITGIVPDDAMERLFQDGVVPPARLDCACSPAMSHVIMKGLSIRAADRYQSISELWEAICKAEEDPDYVPASAADPDDERTVFSASVPMRKAEEEDATVYAGASRAAADDGDATVYSGHAPQQDHGTRKAAPAPKTAATAARSERFQRSTGATMQRPVREAAVQPAAQAAPAAEEKPAKKKKSRLPVILGVAVLVLLAVGLGMFLAGKLGGGQTAAPDGQQAVTLPAMDQSEISELMGGDISVSTKEATFTVPLETRNMIERGYKLESAGKDPLPSQLAAGATCDAVLVDPQGVRGQIVYTLQNFLNVPAPVEESVIVAVAIDDIAGQESLAVSCKSGGGELKVTRDTDLETLEQEAEALHLSLQKDPDADCWRVYLDPDGSGAYLEFRLGEDGETLDIYISTGHVVEEYYEAHPPVQQPVMQPSAGETVVTGMSYDRDELIEQMGGDMELYWNGHTMRLPTSVLELKEQGFPLDNWSGSEVPQTIAAGIQKTAMIDNEYSDKGYMYIGVHNYTSTEQPVDGCWIADVEIFGVPNYRDLQLNWWTPGGQFFIHSGMTSDEIRQEAANNNVCVLPDDAVNSDWPEDMMLSVAEDGSLVQLVLFFDENGTLCDMSILMHHVYERYFEMYPEEAVPQTVSVAAGDIAGYDRNTMIEEIGGEITVTHNGITTPFPISLGEMKARGYGITEFAGEVLPGVVEPNGWHSFAFANSPFSQYSLENYASEAISADYCMLTDALFSPWGDVSDMKLTWQTSRGGLEMIPGMYLEDVEKQMGAAGLRWVPHNVESDEHTVRVLSMGEDERYANVIVFFIPETEKVDGIHVSIGGSMRSYFERHPEQAVPTEIGPDYRVEEVREAMGITVNAVWSGYNITLPLPAGDLIAQGYTMDCMLFRDVAEPYEGFNAMFMNSAGKESRMMYWLSNFTDRELPVEQCLITEVQVTIEESTKDLVVTVQLPQGTFRVAAGMTRDEVEVQMAALGLRYSDPEPNTTTRKIELMSREGEAFLDVDFDENGVLLYVRAWVDGYCAKYYGLIPTP